MHHKVEPLFVAAVTGYEFAALVAHSDRLPTITTLVARLPKLARRSIGLAGGLWLWWHFETDGHR